MPMSVDMKKAVERAEAIDRKLTLSDLRCIAFFDSDAGFFGRLDSALVLKYGEWYLLFQEHSRPQVMHADDALVLQYNYDRKLVAIEEVTDESLPFRRNGTMDGQPLVVEMGHTPEPEERVYFFNAEGKCVPALVESMAEHLIVLKTPPRDVDTE